MIGDLSARYESNGDPGTISSGYGDAGGKSYGCYQFAINAGVPQAFVAWLINLGHAFGAILASCVPGSGEFDVAWRQLAGTYPADFAQAQHDYVQAYYFEPAIINLRAIGFEAMGRSEALHQVIWSRAVQYSARWIPDLFTEAAALAGQELIRMSDRDLIWWVYEVNLTDPEWTAGSPALRPGLFARFQQERQDALAMLGVI